MLLPANYAHLKHLLDKVLRKVRDLHPGGALKCPGAFPSPGHDHVGVGVLEGSLRVHRAVRWDSINGCSP